MLPADREEALRIVVDALPAENPDDELTGFESFALLPFVFFVADHGIDHFEPSMTAQYELTKRFTAEFSIRAFLERYPDETLARLRIWTADPNVHVRRLVSEGTRPRLPWAPRLRSFQADPTPVLELLELLKDDPEEYVRRSVANNLNDIAKDHADRVAALAARWLADASPERRRLVRHACRGLVKAGHPAALAALGLAPAPVRLDRLSIATPVVRFGEALSFEIVLALDGAEPREIALDYVVRHRKANGGRTPKVFKWRVLTLVPGAPLRLARRHPMRPITTRVYRDGPHRLEVVANGATLGGAEFELTGSGR
jgi:3-methyladenine DNA glycosylase AlkC